MSSTFIRSFVLCLTLGLLSGHARAADDTLIFTAAPRGDLKLETSSYQPVADYLSKVIGRKVVYEFSDNWLLYEQNMVQDKYDIVFDGPHFVSWRIEHLNHVPMVKLPQPHVWVVIGKKGDAPTNINALTGRPVCAPAPPNFGTLTLETLFPNPVRQPYIVQTKGWREGFDGVVQGRCVATILPLTNWHKFDAEGTKTKIVYQHRAYPNQAITVSAKRFSPEMQAKIRAALLSPEGQEAMKALRVRYAMVKGQPQPLVAAAAAEYVGVDEVLVSVYPFQASEVQSAKK